MSRGGRHKDQDAGPERRCIVSGESGDKAALIRFVVSPDNVLVADLAGKLPGRGIYVSATREALEKATAKGHFARAARTKVDVPDALADHVEAGLSRRITDLISLARKSGVAVAGYEKVKSQLDREDARVLIQAVDGSGRGKSKLSTPHRGHYIGWLTADELGLAFGREKVIHAALGAGGLTQRVVEEAARLKGLRVTSSDTTGGQVGRKKEKDAT